MSEKNEHKVKLRFYEYILHWIVTLFLLILAIPMLIFKGLVFLVYATGNPAKSIGNLLGFILVVIIVAGGYLSYKIFYPYDIGDEVKSVIIDDDHPFSETLVSLNRQGIIRDGYLFRQLVVRTGVDKQVSPGRYDFFGNVSLWSVYNKFKNRDIATVLVTIPEGLPSWKIASIFQKELQIDSSRFMDIVFDSGYAERRYNLKSLEGYLFPETYRFWYGIDANEVIDIMVNEYFEQTRGLFTKQAPNGLGPEKTMVMASIIEAEATRSDEMPLVSSVYHNRLERRMMLQADPTVIYGLGGLDRPLNRRDIRLLESPYNTYKRYGLPPGPINSPGLDAIEAALDPDSTDYLYFVADGKGGHIFSRTLLEHNRARNKIKRQRALEANQN